MEDAQFSGTSLKVDEDPADILTMMLWSFFALKKTGTSQLRRRQDFYLLRAGTRELCILQLLYCIMSVDSVYATVYAR